MRIVMSVNSKLDEQGWDSVEQASDDTVDQQRVGNAVESEAHELNS